MERFEIDYALNKQVPAMRNNVTLCSDYGDLKLYGASAARVATAVEQVLKAKLATLERQERQAKPED